MKLKDDYGNEIDPIDEYAAAQLAERIVDQKLRDIVAALRHLAEACIVDSNREALNMVATAIEEAR